MADKSRRPVLPDMSPWRRPQLTIPPDSTQAWVRLVAWECWMGMLLAAAIGFGAELIATATDGIVTVFDLSNCYASSVVQPCERVAYRTGTLNAVFNIWCGVMLLAFAVLLVWELWIAAAPKPITDDFLQLLDDSFARDWRKPRTWPWARAGWAFGFTLVGAGFAASVGLTASTIVASRMAKAPAVHVDTSQRFRPIQDGRSTPQLGQPAQRPR